VEVEVHDDDLQRGLLDGLGLVGQSLDLDRAVDKVGMLLDDDARQRVVGVAELAAQVADLALSNFSSISVSRCEIIHDCRMAGRSRAHPAVRGGDWVRD
jgi:hypothetical protein